MHHLITVKLNLFSSNLAIASWVDVDHIVSTMVVSTVYQDSMQHVAGRVALLRILQVLVQVQLLRELKSGTII